MKTRQAMMSMLGLAMATGAAAAAIEAGKAKVAAVCAACHGANGVSIADTIPNLAGQRVAYLESQLRALKAGTRKAASMNAIAAQLSPADIGNVAAYFGSLNPANLAAKSEQLPTLSKTFVTLPAGYQATDKAGYKLYQTVNSSDINQVRYLYANPLAWQAAREGRPLPDGSVLILEQHAAKLDADKTPVPGADGFFQADRLLGYAVMAHSPDWGKDFPDMLRDGNWNYAVFNPDLKQRAGVNQADCLTCHKPLDKQNFLFSFDPLHSAAKR